MQPASENVSKKLSILPVSDANGLKPLFAFSFRSSTLNKAKALLGVQQDEKAVLKTPKMGKNLVFKIAKL